VLVLEVDPSHVDDVPACDVFAPFVVLAQVVHLEREGGRKGGKEGRREGRR